MKRHPFLLTIFVITIFCVSISIGYSKNDTAKSLLNKLKAELEGPSSTPQQRPKLTENLSNIVKPPEGRMTEKPAPKRSINNAPWRWNSSRSPKIAAPESKSIGAMIQPKNDAVSHSVQSGETMTSIARYYGISESRLRALNGVYGNTNPIAGQVVNLKGQISAEALAEADRLTAKNGRSIPRLPMGVDGYEVYTIKSGDNPSRIANKFNVSSKELMTLNEIYNPRLLKIGQKLRIPKKKIKTEPAFDADGYDIHVIGEGESLWSIAQKHGVEYYALIGLNSITNPTGLKIGQKLKIPDTKK